MLSGNPIYHAPLEALWVTRPEAVDLQASKAGETLTLIFGGANCGIADIPSGWRIRYYASVDTTITSADYFLYEAVADFGIGTGRQATFSEAFTFPSNVPRGQYYIGWVYDPDNEVCESNESNNAGYIKMGRLTVETYVLKAVSNSEQHRLPSSGAALTPP